MRARGAIESDRKRRLPVPARAPKLPFRIGRVLARVRKAIEPYPKAALFQLRDEGHGSVFEQLLACLLSIRTLDEVSLRASRRLFARARTPEAILAIPAPEIDRLIRPCTFHLQKAYRIRDLAEAMRERFPKRSPCDPEALAALPGIGPKCANLVAGIGCDRPSIAVDVHVHRITRRWGYVVASTPEKAAAELATKLPKRYWIELNALLVPFGKHVCRGPLPKCSVCPVLRTCRQVGVVRHA